MARFVLSITTVLVVCSMAAAAHAAGTHDEAAATRSMSTGGSSVRSQAQGWIVPPEKTLVVGGGLSVLTSTEELEPLVGVPELTQTDVVMLGLSTRYAWGKRVELFGSGTLLPKKPATVEAKFWQSASLGAVISLSKRDTEARDFRERMRERELAPPKFALWTQVDGGTLLDDLGYWNSAVVGGQFQQAIDRYVRLKARLGVNGTALWLDDFGLDPPRFTEILVGGELVFGESDVGAFWIASDFYFPFYSSSGGTNDDLGTEYVLDPTTRANVHVVGALTFIEDWDIYLQISVLDRGELEQIETTLPILPEGFDQTTITLGLNHRWTFEDEDDKTQP
jgi:hypothetical protein